MKQEKIRISKPPEERKQEIMDTAMVVFAEKGYEQTTMRDIAEAVGIVPGLCYRYFESKQVLFEAAVRRYVSCLLYTSQHGDGLANGGHTDPVLS